MGIYFGKKCSTNSGFPRGNPDPSRWRILDFFQCDNGYAIKVRYLDCTNFEGVKILVCPGRLQIGQDLDPHFCDSELSPVARFKPDNIGWDRAKHLARTL